jgi:MFS family permease
VTAPERPPAEPSRGDLALYLLGTGSWFAALGVQSVLFAWLVTVSLHETPEKVGLAQFCMMLPTLCLILFGGVLADRVGGARVALVAQGLACVPVLSLALVVGLDGLVYPLILLYALCMGAIQAFVTPARDGLLSQIAGARIQRTVVLASLVQFGVQILGFGVAGLADGIGAAPVLTLQAVLLAAGAVAFAALGARLRRADVAAGTPPPARPALGAALREGFATVAAAPPLRAVVAMNVCVGLFFMGAFQVGVPLLVREVHDGTSGQLALVNTAHMLGIVATTVMLLQLGDIDRRGRALILGVLAGAGALAGMGLASSLWALLAFNGLWGIAGGVVMSMSRTIMQEAAPPDRRGRVMAFFSLSFMGAGPLGALLSGFLVDAAGVHLALVIPGAVIAACALVLALRTRLWSLSAATLEPAPVGGSAAA